MDGGILVSEIDSLELVQDDPREYHKVISSSEGKYCCRTMTAIQVMYLIAVAGWLLLLYLHGLFNKLDVGDDLFNGNSIDCFRVWFL